VVDTTKGEIIGLKDKYYDECAAASKKHFVLPQGGCLDFSDASPATVWLPSSVGPVLNSVSQSEYTYKCTDKSGNVATKVVGIEIGDITPPVIRETEKMTVAEKVRCSSLSL
jgi:hypothetical protein